jgi:hypothetical protein
VYTARTALSYGKEHRVIIIIIIIIIIMCWCLEDLTPKVIRLFSLLEHPKFYLKNNTNLSIAPAIVIFNKDLHTSHSI